MMDTDTGWWWVCGGEFKKLGDDSSGVTTGDEGRAPRAALSCNSRSAAICHRITASAAAVSGASARGAMNTADKRCLR